MDWTPGGVILSLVGETMLLRRLPGISQHKRSCWRELYRNLPRKASSQKRTSVVTGRVPGDPTAEAVRKGSCY